MSGTFGLVLGWGLSIAGSNQKRAVWSSSCPNPELCLGSLCLRSFDVLMPNNAFHDNLKSSEPLRRAPMAGRVSPVGPAHDIYMYPTILNTHDGS
jgi:hypothetical protein